MLRRTILIIIVLLSFLISGCTQDKEPYTTSKTKKSSSNQNPPQNDPKEEVMKAAKLLLENTQYRKIFIMDQARPVSHPDLFKAKFNLNDYELAALCLFALRVNNYENAEIARQYSSRGFLGFTTQPSSDFWEAMRWDDSIKDSKDLVDKIESKIGLNLNLDN